MGRLKLPEQAKRKLRQYYLTQSERVQMDAYLKQIRSVDLSNVKKIKTVNDFKKATKGL